MSIKLWEASKKQKKTSELFAFEKFISKKLNIKFQNNYQEIHNWSVKNSSDFWDLFWDFSKIKGKKPKKNLKNQVYFMKIFFYQNQN